MRGFLLTIFMGAGYLLRIVGGFALMGLFFYGIYVFFAKSIAIGLMMIGGAVVGGWVVQIVSTILIGLSIGAATIGLKDE